MNVLSCIKRVPNTGAKIVLTEDRQRIDTSNLGFTMSPHEECAIEEAIQLIEDHGGTAHVLTLGPEEADEQLRTGLAMQADEATLLETDGEEWSPRETADAIANAIQELEDDGAFDLLLFGNESADAGNYQVGVRVARTLGLPCVTGIKSLDVEDGTAIAKREVAGGEEVYEIDLPAVVAVKEGINEPRYASMRAKMQARKQEVPRLEPEGTAGAGTFEKVRLEAPETDDSEAEILGDSPDAVPNVVDVLEEEVEVL
ncbi:electron transfer flavoprotein subunit beta/FixA family protein [Natronobacterium gregoryi]|uniref:Electron transfer flavoprotein subunit beta n=2 Tax=Natronobacterium gregoryi TaxID=44930 RepID=L0ALY3_NATGS|nr:electron transfer flavoprotein subunit beta/FixA family protein [Natronobacterium gregoryi]AFZ74060.1 electron transfer flavoprotein, beta subunit [Natronobacterium gregoryi SP2]ELY70362.1 electron transfer flavoprotein subunit beta [Natronobacterium gregoryi SP2]PLK20802.1 electron transfer flavoprotein subunit beta [Natronobacterium gregoryi SP2]SFJ06537.1 electron transfer flavoprotein beta subunit [Natronobacterium gregoryi]